jgi:hypothetical protein
MQKGHPIERWDMCMKADLKVSKDNSKSPFGWKSIKELGQGESLSSKKGFLGKQKLGLGGQGP